MYFNITSHWTTLLHKFRSHTIQRRKTNNNLQLQIINGRTNSTLMINTNIIDGTNEAY